MQVRWTAPAAQDFEEITLYIRNDSESTALVVAKTLFDTANSLDLLPSRGRLGRIPNTLELVVPGLPYIVVYQVTKATIQILHIYHGARDWPGRP
jgi:plasmid stabilization system protein ParE